MDKNLEGFKKERVRFPIVKKQSNVIFDELAFIANKSSTNARKITTLKECIKLNIWYDKHYHDRHHLGENNGDVREGI